MDSMALWLYFEHLLSRSINQSTLQEFQFPIPSVIEVSKTRMKIVAHSITVDSRYIWSTKQIHLLEHTYKRAPKIV